MIKIVAERPGQKLAVDADVTPDTMTTSTPGYLIDERDGELLSETPFQTLLKLGYWVEVEPYLANIKEWNEDRVVRDERGRFAEVATHRGQSHRFLGGWGKHESKLHERLHFGRDPQESHRHTRFGALLTKKGGIFGEEAKEWDESLHERDDHGRFTSGGESAGSAVTPKMQANAEKWFAERGFSREALAANTRAVLDRASADTVAKGMQWYQHAHDVTGRFAQQYGVPQDAVAGVVAALSPQVRWSDCESADDCPPGTGPFGQWKNSNQDQAERVLQTLAGQYGTTMEITPEQAREVFERDSASPLQARAANPLNAEDYNGVDVSRHGENFTTGEHDVKTLPPDILATFAPGTSGMMRENATKAFMIAMGDDPDDVLGGAKVRAFYNNILHPGETDDVTIDGHQARLMIGTGYVSDKDTAATIGTIGRYQYMGDAVRAVARDMGLTPAQAQAISWEQWRIENPLLDRRAQTIAAQRMSVPTAAMKEILELRGDPDDTDLMSEELFTRLVQDDNVVRAQTRTKERDYVRDDLGRFAETPSLPDDSRKAKAQVAKVLLDSIPRNHRERSAAGNMTTHSGGFETRWEPVDKILGYNTAGYPRRETVEPRVAVAIFAKTWEQTEAWAKQARTLLADAGYRVEGEGSDFYVHGGAAVKERDYVRDESGRFAESGGTATIARGHGGGYHRPPSRESVRRSAYDVPLFMHGTSYQRAEEILREGLKKDIGIKNWTGKDGTVESESGKVYLTTSKDEANFFGSMVATMVKDEQYAILEIKIPDDVAEDARDSRALASDPNMELDEERQTAFTYAGDIPPEWIVRADAYAVDEYAFFRKGVPEPIARLKALSGRGGLTLYMPVSMHVARQLFGDTKERDYARDEDGRFASTGTVMDVLPNARGFAPGTRMAGVETIDKQIARYQEKLKTAIGSRRENLLRQVEKFTEYRDKLAAAPVVVDPPLSAEFRAGLVDVAMYHGTSREQIDTILEEGLKPGSKVGVSNWGISEENRVYMSTNKRDAHYFGSIAADRVKESEYVILRIEVPESHHVLLASDRNMPNSASALTYPRDIDPKWIKSAEVYDRRTEGSVDELEPVERLKEATTTYYVPVSRAVALQLLGGTKERDYVRDELGRFSETAGESAELAVVRQRTVGAIEKLPTFEKLVDLMRETDGVVVPKDDYRKPTAELAQFYSALPGNQDAVLASMARDTGFDNPPEVVSTEELDQRIADGAPELWRGMTDSYADWSGNSIKVEPAQELKSGDYYAGKGAYGNGMYFAETVDPRSPASRYETARFVQDYAGGATGTGDVVRATLAADAKVGDWEQIQREMRDEAEAFQRATDWGKDVDPAYAQAVDHVLHDEGRYAVTKGYDAYRVNGGGSAQESFVVVLNRAALVVDEKVYDPQGTDISRSNMRPLR